MDFPINVFFKIVRNRPELNKINIKMCRQNSPRPIDDYPSYCVSYDKLDFSNLYNFQESLRVIVSDNALQFLMQEPIIPENESSKEVETLDLEDMVGEIITIPFGFDNKLKEIEL